MNIFTKAIKPAFFGVLLFVLSGMHVAMADGHANADPVMFTLDDKDYKVSDLPQLLQHALFEAEQEHYEAKKAIVDEALAVMEIEKRAKEAGKSSEELAAELFAAEQPSDEAVNSFYEQNKARINQPLDAIKPQIIQMLAQQGQALKQQAFLAGIKEGKTIQLGFEKPVAPVSEIASEGYPEKGAKDAKVVLVEFADYQCPHCKRAGEVLKKVSEQFKDDLKIIFMDYPINRSGISRKIAEGGACAAKQDKFWEYHDLAFSDQRALKADSPTAFAKELGLDEAAFAECLASDYPAEHVKKSEAEGQRLGVNSTPTIFLNGQKLQVNNLETGLPEAIKATLEKAE